jgi:hypothetical protein
VVEGPGGSTAAERARWLAELSETLGEAQRLLLRIGVSGADNRQAMELYSRIEGARLAIQSLRLRRSAGSRNVSDPKWTDPLPWERGQKGPA